MFSRSCSEMASFCSRYCCSFGLRRLELLALLGEPLPEPVAGILRRRELELEALLDVVLAPAC